MFDAREPQDIFAETDKAAPQVSSPTAAPVLSTPPPTGEAISDVEATSTQVAQTVAPSAELPAPTHRGGGGLKVAVIVAAILVIIGGAFLISWRILRSRTPVTPSAPVVSPLVPNERAGSPETDGEVGAPARQPEPEPSPALDKDTDLDGLSDLREAELGTNLNTPDTDNDGLFDREETEVYSTNPLNPDTDGDGYSDGVEVKGGYNPNGPGKFLEVPN